MKLRNKKSGEIIDADFNATISGRTNIIIIQNGPEQLEYNSLAELNEEWEDYEEAKENYVLNFNGDTLRWDNDKRDRKITKQLQEIGNYFETEEEAEKAVERLRAWKRLKDKGFKFTGLAGISNSISFTANKKYESSHIAYDPYVYHEEDINRYILDLDLLFGGEE